MIATGLDPVMLRVRTVLDGQERQNYPVSDMIFPPARLVSLLSQDMTLMPGDVIACGTSVGVGTMKNPKNTVEVSIEGVGTLRRIIFDPVRSEVRSCHSRLGASKADSNAVENGQLRPSLWYAGRSEFLI